MRKPSFAFTALNTSAELIHEAGRLVWLVDSGLSDLLHPQSIALDMGACADQPKVTVAKTLPSQEVFLRAVLDSLEHSAECRDVATSYDKVGILGLFIAGTAARNALLGCDISAIQFLMSSRDDRRSDPDVAVFLLSKALNTAIPRSPVSKRLSFGAPMKLLFKHVQDHFLREDVACRLMALVETIREAGVVNWTGVRELGQSGVVRNSTVEKIFAAHELGSCRAEPHTEH